MPTSTPTRTPSAAPILTSTPTSSPVAIRSIQMVDTTTGWAEGYVGSGDSIHILRTADGGMTWRDVTPLQLDSYGLEAFFLDAQLAWAWDSEAGVMWRTRDGGQSWSDIGDPTWPDTIWFNDSQHGWKANGEPHGMSFPGYDFHSFATTQDGGQTWEEKTLPPGGGFPFLAFPDERTAWLVRASYRVAMPGWADLGVPIRIRTTFDGGRTWRSRRLPLPAGTYTFNDRYEDIDMGSYLGGVGNCNFVSPVYSSTAIWKLVLTCEEGSWMYTSANQGKTWIISPLPRAGQALDLEFISPTIGWLLQRDRIDHSQSRLYLTTNGGQSWNLIKRTGWMNARLEFVDEDTGWAVACAEWRCYQYDAVRALVKTTDGGRSWQLIEPQLAP